jgi:hypothetical protein
VATNVPTETPTNTATPTPTNPPVETLVATPTSGPRFGVKDVDKDLLPDAVFTVRGTAEVVLNILNTPAKIVFGNRWLASDLGIAPGDDQHTLITVAAVKKSYRWIAKNLMTGATALVGSSTIAGSPVVGCYTDNVYTPAVLVRRKGLVWLELSTSPRPTVRKLSARVVSMKCGSPENGTSSLFTLELDPARKTRNVKGMKGTRVFLNSPRLSPRFTTLSLHLLPRGESGAPTPMILAQQGNKSVIQVLTKDNKWQSLSLPALPVGSRYTDISGIRYGDSSYVVLQVTNKRKVTSYTKIEVPSSLL